MPLNQAGQELRYPSKTGGEEFFWDYRTDPNKNSQIHLDSSLTKFTQNVDGSWKGNDYSKVRLKFMTSSRTHEAKEGCNFDFKVGEGREYMTDERDWKNFEFIMRAKINNMTDDPSKEFILKTSARHTSSVCCQGNSMWVRLRNINPIEVQGFKEMWHVNYFSRDSKKLPQYAFKPEGHGWFCIKYVSYLKEKNGKRGRIVEMYLDMDGDGKNFDLVLVEEDYGGWGSGGGKCNGNADQISLWGWPTLTFRIDDGTADVDFWSVHCREIDISKSFDDVGENPDTSTGTTTDELFFLYTFNFDANLERGYACAVAATTHVEIYNVPTPTDSSEMDDTGLDDDISMAAEYIRYSTSRLISHAVNIVEVELIAFNPGSLTGNVEVLVIDENNVTMATIGTIAASSVSTSWTRYSFTNDSNTYKLKHKDAVVVKYANGTASNKIKVRRLTSSGQQFDDNNNSTIYRRYNKLTSSWSDHTSYELIGFFKEKVV